LLSSALLSLSPPSLVHPRCGVLTCCEAPRAIGITTQIAVPANWHPGADLWVTASDGNDVALPVPFGYSHGDILHCVEATVPYGCVPGDSITVIVADPHVEDFMLEVPEEYSAGDLMVVIVEQGSERPSIDWDQEWVSFQQRRPLLEALRRFTIKARADEGLATAATVAATSFMCYAVLHYMLHSAGGGMVLVPDGEFGIRSHQLVELHPVAQRLLGPLL